MSDAVAGSAWRRGAIRRVAQGVACYRGCNKLGPQLEASGFLLTKGKSDLIEILEIILGLTNLNKND